jgi:uncharacterized protein YutD
MRKYAIKRLIKALQSCAFFVLSKERKRKKERERESESERDGEEKEEEGAEKHNFSSQIF